MADTIRPEGVKLPSISEETIDLLFENNEGAKHFNRNKNFRLDIFDCDLSQLSYGKT